MIINVNKADQMTQKINGFKKGPSPKNWRKAGVKNV